MAKETDEWEFSKENIQPLQRGRKPNILKVALTSADDIQQMRHDFEKELRTYTGDDPLVVWCKYIHWVEQNFIKGGREGQVMQLMQKCLSTLKEETKYYNDTRFVDIWVKFASMSAKPLEVYEYMFSQKIGCQHATFFTAWSWELEQLGNFKKADQVLTSGLQHKAEPIESLKIYCKNFEMRISSKIVPAQDAIRSENERVAFSALKPHKKQAAPVQRTGDSVLDHNRAHLTLGRQQPQPKSNVPPSKVPFKIYTSENVASSLPLQSKESVPFTMHSDVSKENEKKPSKWNKVKVKQDLFVTRPPSEPAFKLHQDENPDSMSTPMSKVSNVLKPRKGDRTPPLFLFEAPDPKIRPMYDKRKVYAGTEEFSLEEIRSSSWFQKQKQLEMEKKLAEQERILAENQRLICEQNEQIKKLQQQIRVTNTPRETQIPTNSVVSTQGFSLESTIASNAKVDTKCHIENNSVSRIFPDGLKLTNSYKEASLLTHDLYSGTILKNDDFLSHSKTTGNSLTSSQPQPETNILSAAFPFSFYCDTTEKLTLPIPFKEKHSPQPELGACKQKEEDDVENVPPADYLQATKKRELTGVLQPSKDIEFQPLEVQDVDETEDIEEEISFSKKVSFQDETMIPPNNTEQFSAAAFMSSTPHNLNRCKTKSVLGIPCQSQQNSLEPSIKSPKTLLFQASNEISTNNFLPKADRVLKNDQSGCTKLPAQLSVIMELSRECYKSSSSSGSSASTTKLSQLCYSQEKSNAQKYISKIDTFKEPMPINANVNTSHFDQKSNLIAFLKSSNESQDFEIHVSDVNPFDPELNEQFLSSLNLSDDYFGEMSVCDKSINFVRTGLKITLKNCEYLLKDIKFQGGFGVVYKAMDINSDARSRSNLALKKCKGANNWEFYICKTLHKRLEHLNQTPDTSASIMNTVHAVKCIDGVLLADKFCEKGTLIDFAYYYNKQMNSCVPEPIVMYLTYEMLHTMLSIHECKILHCDVKPNNILINDWDLNVNIFYLISRKTGLLKFIDFGCAVDLEFFKGGICFQTICKDGCPDAREGKPWLYQQDWFGIASCVHTLLFSTPMKVKQNEKGRWDIENKFKRYHDATVWKPLFNELLNMPSCYQQPDIKKFTSLIEDKLQKNASVLKIQMEKLTRDTIKAQKKH